VPTEGRIVWSGSFNTTEMRCTAETVTVDGVEQVLHIKDGRCWYRARTARIRCSTPCDR
jgi:hypothetical protein